MARSLFRDYLQVHSFWLLDVAPIEGLALPIFTPLAGFSEITAPGMSFEMYDITEGNWLFRKKVVKKADIDMMTLTRGVTFWDSDFYKWSMAALTGNTSGVNVGGVQVGGVGGVTPRRNLMLVHFFARYPGDLAAGIAGGLITAGAIQSVGAVSGGNGVNTAVGAARVAAQAAAASFGPADVAAHVPARAWMLYDCIPTRFKSGGDFDAKNGDVSIAELDIQPEMIEEISLSTIG